MGVQSSPFSLPAQMGRPCSSRAVAGAGTGRIPWAHFTVPLPTAMGEQTIFSGLSSPSSQHTASTSARASREPTSWRWMFSTGSPWT